MFIKDIKNINFSYTLTKALRNLTSDLKEINLTNENFLDELFCSIGFLFDEGSYKKSVNKINDALTKNRLKENMFLHRVIDIGPYSPKFEDTRPLKRGKFPKEDYINKSIFSYTSTSRFKTGTLCGNVNLELIVPKGTQGIDITLLSSFSSEYEILLNACDLYILDYEEQPGQYGYNTRRTFTAFVLSKDRSCYNDIAQTKDFEDENE